MTEGATLEELRALARRSRRTASWGAFAIVGTLMLFPVVALAIGLAPALYAWAMGGALVAGGALFLRFAYVAGEERGEYRKVFARVKQDREARRVPVAEGSRAEPPAQSR